MNAVVRISCSMHVYKHMRSWRVAKAAAAPSTPGGGKAAVGERGVLPAGVRWQVNLGDRDPRWADQMPEFAQALTSFTWAIVASSLHNEAVP